jgi:hypothetical protein
MSNSDYDRSTMFRNDDRQSYRAYRGPRQKLSRDVKLLGTPLTDFLSKNIEATYAEADRLFASNVRAAAILYEAALMMDLTHETTARAPTMALLNIHTDLHRDEVGCIRSLSMTAHKTESHQSFKWAISARLGARLEHHLEIYRPHLPAAKSERLFLSGKGEGSTVQSIRIKISQLLQLMFLNRISIEGEIVE